MSGTEISKLTLFAKNYVESAKIDENNNGTIEAGRELSRLLAGTAANSIEDLSVDNIKQKMQENDTEKIFTAIMTQKGLKATTRYGNTWRQYLDQVEADIQNCIDRMSLPIVLIDSEFKMIKNGADNLVKMIEGNSNENPAVYKYLLENIQKNLNLLEESVQTITFMGDNLVLYDDPEADIPYRFEESVGLYQCNLSQHLEFVQNLQAELNEKLKGDINTSECLPILKDISEKINSAMKDFDNMTTRYNTMLKKDKEFICNLEKVQKEFMKDDITTDEEREKSKELLSELIETVSPWTRELLIQQAEAAYKYDADNQSEDDDNTTTDMKTIGVPSMFKADTEGFKKVLMPRYGVVLMNQSTGEIKSLNGMVIKPAR